MAALATFAASGLMAGASMVLGLVAVGVFGDGRSSIIKTVVVTGVTLVGACTGGWGSQPAIARALSIGRRPAR